MTSTAALSVNTAVSANASAAASAPSAQNAFGSNARADFRKPLQQARQQHQQQSQASRQAPVSRDPASSNKTATTQRHASSSDSHDQDDKESSNPSASTPDPATAMLALLGQSIPAQAAATPAPAPVAGGQDDASPAVATVPAGLQAMAGLQGQGMMQPGTQADADDMLDAKSVDALKDDALSTSTSSADEGDETTATKFTDVLSAMAKTSSTGQTSQPASSDHGNTLDALNALVGQPLPQAQQAASITPAAHVLTLQASAGTPAFAQELGQQVAWLGGQDVKEARIRLHPEDLGQLDVKVSVKQDHVDVSFIAQHPQAVHAVQQTLGQLDTLLAHHGLSLGHAEVGQGGRGNESGQGASSSGTNSGADDSSTESGGIAAVAAPVIKAIGLLDTFA
ncbi:flagellar hook-length control protein FliK [Dyella amyloliquefaciens]|uniref:flagellar hook-length control protein FliK n=1 Tax=Dyella amyloliquefaciens TaxID=1770545 RepID=UPI00102E8D71|nr:flagellar hook-length control protein FliK [Dyella amyloliquefaciens]